MDNLKKCAMELSSEWKRCFGLHTYYTGYLTGEMALLLMNIYRDWDGDVELWEMSPADLYKAISDKTYEINRSTGMRYPYFNLHADEMVVLPKLISVMEEYNLGVDQATWDEFSRYILKKGNRR